MRLMEASVIVRAFAITAHNWRRIGVAMQHGEAFALRWRVKVFPNESVTGKWITLSHLYNSKEMTE
jgi:hypothetical protein